MDYETVVKIGEKVGNHEMNFFSSFAWWQWVIYILIFLTVIIVSLEFDLDWLLVLTIIVMVFCLPIHNYVNKSIDVFNKNDKEISAYKKDYGNKYIDELPLTNAEIIYMKIDNEAEVSGSMILGSGTTKSDFLTTLTISYKLNNKAITETFKIAPDLDLSSEEKPYITYQELNKKLPHYELGKYNLEIHLPESYVFTDIK